MSYPENFNIDIIEYKEINQVYSKTITNRNEKIGLI